MAFGSDGYLYLTVGDPRGNGQDLNGTIYIMTSDSPGPNGQGQISRVEQV